jgi:hypothetical protein
LVIITIIGIAMMGPSERAWRKVRASSDPRRELEQGLSPADLRSLLMAVSQRRAEAVTPARLLSRWESDRYVRVAGCDPRRVSQVEARLWQLLPDDFTGVDLSPVAPLGTSSALGPVSQHKVISTTRGTEVVSDPTNVLALEAAVRRRRPVNGSRSSGDAVHLAACHRVLRGQPFNDPGLYQHFRLFTLVSSARDRGSASTEATLLITHLQFWARALGDVLPGRRVELSYTGFGFPPLAERIRDTVLPALGPLPGNVTVKEDPARERARGYYERGAFRIVADDDEVGDGGFTTWTAQLLSNAKERCLISCVATERLTALADRDLRYVP